MLWVLAPRERPAVHSQIHTASPGICPANPAAAVPDTFLRGICAVRLSAKATPSVARLHDPLDIVICSAVTCIGDRMMVRPGGFKRAGAAVHASCACKASSGKPKPLDERRHAFLTPPPARSGRVDRLDRFLWRLCALPDGVTRRPSNGRGGRGRAVGSVVPEFGKRGRHAHGPEEKIMHGLHANTRPQCGLRVFITPQIAVPIAPITLECAPM